MKRISVLFLLGMCLGYSNYAQDQLENAGFEEWENILATVNDTIREPLEWSSLKTSDLPNLAAMAPVVCTRSNEAYAGNYSMKLTNASVFGLVANGIATNGRIHPDLNTELSYSYTDTDSAMWNSPFTARPDSLIGWYQYSPQGNDSLQVKVSLHQGYGQQPDEDFENNWIGLAEFRTGFNTEGVWTRFSVPFIYFSEDIPEYALTLISSGNAYAAVAKSTALFDDLEMVYVSTSSNQGPARAEGYIAMPRSGTLWLRNIRFSDFNQLSIYSITGRKVWHGKVDSEWIDISAAHLPQGIYLVSLTGSHQVFNQKVMLK